MHIKAVPLENKRKEKKKNWNCGIKIVFLKLIVVEDIINAWLFFNFFLILLQNDFWDDLDKEQVSWKLEIFCLINMSISSWWNTQVFFFADSWTCLHDYEFLFLDDFWDILDKEQVSWEVEKLYLINVSLASRWSAHVILTDWWTCIHDYERSFWLWCYCKTLSRAYGM